MNNTVFFNYEYDSNEHRVKRDDFELFIQDMIENYDYNPETDKIDLKKVFEDYVWKR